MGQERRELAGAWAVSVDEFWFYSSEKANTSVCGGQTTPWV